jgi:ribosomal protein L11 methyltransferase
MPDAEQLLYVYELKGGVPPPVLDLDGLLGIWPEGCYTYLFFPHPAETILAAFLQAHPQFHLTDRYRLRYGDWQDLAEEEPFKVGPFRIATRSLQVDLGAGEIPLWIDPGVIFGSGLHPTTRGCLRALSLVYAQERYARVLDLGAGSGILAIAAAKLGAAEVEAVDLNPLAVSTASDNCRRNGVDRRVRVRLGDAYGDLPAADLLCLNIHQEFLRTFLAGPKVLRYRLAIVSGFLREQLDEIISLLPRGSRLRNPPLIERGWVTLIVVNDDRDREGDNHGPTATSF